MLKTRLCIALISILLFGSSLTGCANLKAVGKFANGTQALSEAAGKFYDLELETDRKLAITTVDLGAKQDRPECQKKDGSYLTPWDCETKGENLISEARRNRAAVSALAQYAQSLKEIAEFNDDANIEKASKELSSNLSTFAKTLDVAADTKESVLANAISGLAKIYIDLRVRKAIYEKARLAQEDVSKIVNMLKDDIKRQQTRLAVSRESAKATREEWFNSFREKYQSNKIQISHKVIQQSEKAKLNSENAGLSIAASALVGDELNDKLANQPSIIFLHELDETANSCLEAHKAIQEPNLSDKSGIIIKFINDAQKLLSTVRQMGN